MHRKHRAKGTWLINLFKKGVMGSFILMMGLFAIYGVIELGEYFFLSTEEKLGQSTDVFTEDREAVDLQDTEVQEIESGYPIGVIEEGVIDIDINTKVQNNTLAEYDANVGGLIGENIGYQQQEYSFEEGDAIVEESQEALDKYENAQKLEEERLQKEESIEKYEPIVSEELIEDLKATVEQENFNLIDTVGDYLEGLVLHERLELMKLSIDKALHVDFLEIWDWIQDGVTDQEAEQIKELVVNNFTVEEMDLLYAHYLQYTEVANT